MISVEMAPELHSNRDGLFQSIAEETALVQTTLNQFVNESHHDSRRIEVPLDMMR